MIKIYDANNYVRLSLEADITGLTARTILSKVMDTNGVHVFVWDGKGSLRKRREIYDAYKRNRSPTRQDIIVGFDTVKEVLVHSPAIQVEVPGYEADDVIASLTRHYAGANETVLILSNDRDFAQLTAEFPNKVFAGFRPKENVPDHLIKYYKITVGDPSDNIPGIAGFGEKTWDNVDKRTLVPWVDQILESGEVTDIGLPPRIKPDPELLRKFSQIIEFLPVSLDEISDHMVLGKPDYGSADAYLRKFLQ